MAEKTDLILNKVKMYYLNEYHDALVAVKSKYFKPSEVVDNAITRCLGVALFAQYLGIDFDDSDREYVAVKEKLEKLLDKPTKA